MGSVLRPAHSQCGLVVAYPRDETPTLPPSPLTACLHGPLGDDGGPASKRTGPASRWNLQQLRPLGTPTPRLPQAPTIHAAPPASATPIRGTMARQV